MIQNCIYWVILLIPPVNTEYNITNYHKFGPKIIHSNKNLHNFGQTNIHRDVRILRFCARRFLRRIGQRVQNWLPCTELAKTAQKL